MSTYYCGIDLHARFSVLGVIDDQENNVVEGVKGVEGNLKTDLFHNLPHLEISSKR